MRINLCYFINHGAYLHLFQYRGLGVARVLLKEDSGRFRATGALAALRIEVDTDGIFLLLNLRSTYPQMSEDQGKLWIIHMSQNSSRAAYLYDECHANLAQPLRLSLAHMIAFWVGAACVRTGRMLRGKARRF